ncbi:hypothetical protein RirG_264220 [Rhizophagus irregularis DAOM 197198w]|uniref:Uncharacterized protein n=1 Tax=Rhizophagus irregularis (strain DAOM 197198w) TaxID=1432141 RepID=A0A015I2G7_RHIIW|nr:hypothetical protein RirG_264220 [Rhizophagus irregularis DAOM 197198w]
MARNNPYINPHNRIQLQGWRANVDLKPILSIHAALQYISKYASKAEPSSLAFSEIFKQILDNSNPDDSSLSPIQKLLLNSVSERDISAQETCHLLNGTALYHSSHSFVSLNVNEEGLRWIQRTGSGDNVEDTGRTTQSALKRYWERPEELEDYSLFELYLTHRFSRGQWKKCKKENIVRVWPRPSSYHNGDQWEAYCRDLLRQPVDEEEVYDEDSEDELPFEEDKDEDEEQYRYDWMRLAKMGPKVIIHCASDLGSRDMD